MLADQRSQAACAFDVENDVGTRIALEHVQREQHQQAVRVHHVACVGHDTDTVAVTVEGQAQIGTGFLDLGNQVLQVFQLARIRVMVGEVAIHFREQGNHFTAQRFDQLRSDHACRAVTAVDHDLQLARHDDVILDLLEVALKDVDLGDAAFLRRQVVGLDALVQRLDLLVGEGVAGDDDLEAVVVLRVMAAGQHDAGLAGQHVGCVIQRRRWHQAYIADVTAAVVQTLNQLLYQFRTGKPTVAANADVGFVLRQAFGADGAADPVSRFSVEGVPDHATDVVGTENSLGKVGCHGCWTVHSEVMLRSQEVLVFVEKVDIKDIGILKQRIGPVGA